MTNIHSNFEQYPPQLVLLLQLVRLLDFVVDVHPACRAEGALDVWEILFYKETVKISDKIQIIANLHDIMSDLCVPYHRVSHDIKKKQQSAD